MNAQEFAALLSGATYLHEITREQQDQAKAAGLIVVFGASDDLMEFRGAIYDELNVCDGGTAWLDGKGLLPDRESIDDDETLRDYFARQPMAVAIEALWCAEPGYTWTFRTSIPHAIFEVVDDGEPYCRGIVFALADVMKGPAMIGDDAPTLPTPTRVHLTDAGAVVVGVPQKNWDEESDDAHNCDAMGCGSFGPHVLYRIAFTDERVPSSSGAERQEVAPVADAVEVLRQKLANDEDGWRALCVVMSDLSTGQTSDARDALADDHRLTLVNVFKRAGLDPRELCEWTAEELVAIDAAMQEAGK